MNLTEISSWEWLFILCLLMVLVWILVVFQARQRSSHEVEFTAEVVQSEESTSDSHDHS